MSKNLRRWLGALVTVIVLGLIVWNFSRGEEWRNFRWDRLWASLVDAKAGYLAAAVALVYASYIVRAYRWRAFLHPIKKGSLWVLFVGQVVGFSAVFLLGRIGELVRPAYIARREVVPFTAMAAVWLLERIYDVVFIIFIFALALYLGPLEPGTRRAHLVLERMHWAGGVVLVLALASVPLLMAFRLHSASWTARLLGWFGFLPARSRVHLEHLLHSFAVGLGVLRSWRDFQLSAALTAVLWLINVSSFWLVLQSMGGRLEKLSWLAAAFVMFISVLGMLAQIPGVGGGFQVLAILVLRDFFRVPLEDATGASLLLWMVISVPCMVLGLVLLFQEGVSLKKLEAMAEKEQASVAEKP